MAKTDLTAQRLRELLHYEPETGIFTRIKYRCARGKAGSVAGYKNAQGYVLFMVDRHMYMAHRLAWLYMTGDHPTGLIDHKDGNKSNNRFSNLRPADRTLNAQNKQKARADSKSGLAGAYYDARWGKWFSNITYGGKRRGLGMFATAQEAHEAYIAAKRQFHEGCTI
jgi:hypothetical protein